MTSGQIYMPVHTFANPSSGVGVSGGADESSFLTPDALLAYCQSRMSALDTQIQSTFAGQKKSNADSQALNGLTEWLNTCTQAGVAGPSSASGCTRQNLVDALLYTINTKGVGTDSKTGKALNELLANANNGVYDGKNAEQIKAAITDTVGGLQKDLNAGAELNMINLQSLMSQRQTAIQLTTNLVQSLGDQMNKIAANIGH